MEPIPGAGVRSSSGERKKQGVADESLRLGEEIRGLMISGPPPETGSSFTALLGLPPDRAMELLHSPDSISTTSPPVLEPPPPPYAHSFAASSPPSFPPSAALLERAGRFSIFAGVRDNSPEASPVSPICQIAKNEPAAETESNPNSSSPPLTSDPKLGKRKEREKKVRVSTKKSKSVAYNESSDDTEKLPYVHVRARRGEATDSHSLAERARREKINARMKLLQELVPGCNKISGTALVLDEIISHVQSLQRQVELLSMRLAVVNPRIDFNLDSLWAAENLSQMDCNFPAMVMPLMLPDVQVNGNRQQSQQLWHMDALRPVWGRGEDNYNFVNPENSLLSYDSLANSVSVHSNQLKMEL